MSRLMSRFMDQSKLDELYSPQPARGQGLRSGIRARRARRANRPSLIGTLLATGTEAYSNSQGKRAERSQTQPPPVPRLRGQGGYYQDQYDGRDANGEYYQGQRSVRDDDGLDRYTPRSQFQSRPRGYSQERQRQQQQQQQQQQEQQRYEYQRYRSQSTPREQQPSSSHPSERAFPFQYSQEYQEVSSPSRADAYAARMEDLKRQVDEEDSRRMMFSEPPPPAYEQKVDGDSLSRRR